MIAEELTIGEIIKSLEKNIFSANTNSEFELKCFERELGIKQAINMCMEQITEFAKSPGLKKLTIRQTIKSKICVENLSKYVKELIDELDESRIKKHINEIENNKNNLIIGLYKPFELDMNFLWSNSFYTAITTEILWAPKVTVLQAMEISRGNLDLDDLGKHLPKIVKELKKDILPYLKRSELYFEFYDSLKEALDCFSKKYYRGCNLIIMTTIEGMVRKLSNFLAVHQQLGDDFSEEKYKSLSSLLRDVKWKKDYKIDSTSLSLLVGENRTIKERRNEIRNGKKEFQFIDLNIRLDFLKGRFKDDRDLILHGSYLEYNKKWNLFLNFSALIETKKVCEYYYEIYGGKGNKTQ